MHASTQKYKLADLFLLITAIALILAVYIRHPIPASVITLVIVGLASLSLANPRLSAVYLRYRYRLMVLVVVLYLVPWLFLTVGF